MESMWADELVGLRGVYQYFSFESPNQRSIDSTPSNKINILILQLKLLTIQNRHSFLLTSLNHTFQIQNLIYNQIGKSRMQSFLGSARIKPRIVLRFITLGLLSMSFLIYRFVYKEYSTFCYNDAWHEFTGDLNADLDKDGKDNVVIGIGQVFMDFWIVAIAVFWMIKLKNTRIPVAAGLFFLARSIMLDIMAFPFPEHIVWHSPGFFSLTVPYDRTRDFFYSGHTGSLTVIILQFYTVGYKWFTLVPVACLIYMMNMLLITRVHYTIDVAGGLIFAFFFFGLSEKIVFYTDWLFSLPYLIGKSALAKFRQSRNNKNPSNKTSLEDIILANQITA